MVANKDIKNELRIKFEELKEQYSLNWKDEFKILGLLLDDLHEQMPCVPELTIRSVSKK